MSKNEPQPERFKDLAYSYKDLSRQEKQARMKELRILRELEKRISDLEIKVNTILETIKTVDLSQYQRGK